MKLLFTTTLSGFRTLQAHYKHPVPQPAYLRGKALYIANSLSSIHQKIKLFVPIHFKKIGSTR